MNSTKTNKLKKFATHKKYKKNIMFICRLSFWTNQQELNALLISYYSQYINLLHVLTESVKSFYLLHFNEQRKICKQNWKETDL